MVSALSKRQQARNEQTLQELIRTVQGNNQCADCQARNPGWASWNLGIFLCLRCATLHRKLGTHISKVKSISLDAWSNENVDTMKKVGNVESNRKYNPQNVKPAMPIDIDEVDGVMERFIRQKYERRQLSDASRPGTRQNTGSTSSIEDRPPPLPPKPTRKFGFGLRSSSSTFPSSRSERSISERSTPALSPQHSREATSPHLNKPSQVFGTDLHIETFEKKLATLREMGFTDEKRNASVLQSLNGSIERSIDALQKLGGDSKLPGAAVRKAPSSNNLNGISIVKKQDPFEALDNAPQPQHTASQQAVQPNFGDFSTAHSQQPLHASNPFMQASQSVQPQETLDQAFQNMSIAQPQPQQQIYQQQQPLFPHNTGPHSQQISYQSNPFMQSFTPPPIPQLPPQYQGMISQPSTPLQQPHSASAAFPAGGNPFLRSSQSQVFQSSNPFNTASNTSSPVSVHQQQVWPTQYATAPQQQQSWAPAPSQSPNPFLQQQHQRQQSPLASPNPYFQHQHQHQYQQSQAYSAQQQPNYAAFSQNQTIPFQPTYTQEQAAFNSNPYQQQPSYPQRADKMSILALYNLPSTNPQSQFQPQSNLPGTPEEPATIPQRAVTMPIMPTNGNNGLASVPESSIPVATSTSSNPFAPNPAVQTVKQGPKIGGPSRESVDFAGLMAGRHSPDAFAGLSARLT